MELESNNSSPQPSDLDYFELLSSKPFLDKKKPDASEDKSNKSALVDKLIDEFRNYFFSGLGDDDVISML